MDLSKISPNMDIECDPFFGDYSKYYVFDLLRNVDKTFSKALGVNPFSSGKCIITYNHRDETPYITKGFGFDNIHLNVAGDYWSQWVFQFAHEYCHHIIGGKMSGEMVGMLWLEECFCEASSLYHLYSSYIYWKKAKDKIKSHYSPAFLEYLRHVLKPYKAQADAVKKEGVRKEWIDSYSSCYVSRTRDITNPVSICIYSILKENPNLWKVLLHFGDTRSCDNPKDFFDNLYGSVQLSYRYSLDKLYRLIFP